MVEKDVKNLHMLQDMYKHWPFFRVTIDFIEMVFAKGDPGIAALYDKLLVSEELWPFGEKLRANFEETKKLVLQVTRKNRAFLISETEHSCFCSEWCSLFCRLLDTRIFLKMILT